jgi:hypothetical protein
MKIGLGNVVLFLWACMKLHLHVYCKNTWQFESKEHLAEVSVLCQIVDHLNCCCNCGKALNIFMLSCGILCCKNVCVSKIKDEYILSFY